MDIHFIILKGFFLVKKNFAVSYEKIEKFDKKDYFKFPVSRVDYRVDFVRKKKKIILECLDLNFK